MLIGRVCFRLFVFVTDGDLVITKGSYLMQIIKLIVNDAIPQLASHYVRG